MKLVALCDRWEEKLQEAGKRYGVATYSEYDKFLEHDMDAVVLANYFHEHATFAIKALDLRVRQRHPLGQAALPQRVPRRDHEQRRHPRLEERPRERHALRDARFQRRAEPQGG